MVTHVDMLEAQAHLPSLLEKVEAGETVVIERDGKSVAQVLACDKTRDDYKPMPSDEWTDAEAKDWLIRSYGLICRGCSYTFNHERFLQLDYDIPLSKGGLERIGNRLLLCAPCAGVKGDALTREQLRDVNRKNGWLPQRRFGSLKGKVFIDDDLFAAPLPDEELALWEGADS